MAIFGVKYPNRKSPRPFSIEHRNNISIGLKGKKRGPLTEEHKKKISESRIGDKNWNFGKHFTQEHRDKISKANKGKISRKGVNAPHYGKKHSEETKKIVSIKNKGYKHTEEAKIKIKNASLGRKLSDEHKLKLSGENNYNWIKDRNLLKTDRRKHYDTQYRYWMMQVKNRDGWKCRIADIKCNGRLEAHHILNWIEHPELRYEINNGITLCHAHHPQRRAEEKRLIPVFQGLVSVSK